MNRADVGMIEGGGCLRFPLETLQSPAISGQRLGQKLEGDKAMQPGVLSLVDHTHAATTKFLQNAIVGNRLARHG
jgi:hypothetical protein